MKFTQAIGVAVLATLTAASAFAAAAPPGDKDVALLLAGVAQIAAPGVPGPLCVFGDKAVVVIVGGAGKEIRAPVVAAGRMGAGRAVAFGHTDYFDAAALSTSDTGRLVVNAVRWAAGGAKPAPRVSVHRQPALAAFLQKQGLQAAVLDGAAWRDGLKSSDVLCVHPASLTADADVAAVSAFVKAGGGLIAADLGWGWLQLHPGKSLLADHPGNRLLAPAGIVWADGTLERTAAAGFAAGDAPSPLTHAGRALEALRAQAAGKSPLGAAEVAQAGRTVTLAARSAPPDDTLFLPGLKGVQEEYAAAAVPTREKPLKSDRPLERLALTLQVEEIKHLPAERIRAHPAAAAFPGAVPADAPRIERTVAIDTAVPGWHSTGLYAPPGEVITVAVPAAAVGWRLAVRIGSHSDRLWGLEGWQRCPEICTQAAQDKPQTRAANAFGGLIYVDAHSGGPGTVAVKVAGAVEAPHYVLGKTGASEWRDKIRLRPAPWAELETRKVILTLPSKVVRGLDDPEDLMKFWDRVMDCCAELAAIPLDRPRPERYVCDAQISAGYMHSGYPIMVLMDMPEVMVDKARMMANGHGGVWGLWHEMGHNHQQGDWTFAGAGEVTVNLFTLYVFEKACGAPKSAMQRASGPRMDKQVKAYIAGGADFEKWKADPFLALHMYAQLEEAFGWDAYKKVFAEYRALPRGERPRGDAEKRDQWMVRFSRTVGRNLGPFFQAWGVPTSEKARASIAGLPAWMPEGFPPK